jgi:hypothetical protein
MSPKDAARVAAVRAAVAEEIARVSGMLASVSDLAVRSRINLLRRDLDEVEPVFLKDVGSSATPQVLISCAELWVAALVRMSEEWRQLLVQYGRDARLVG